MRNLFPYLTAWLVLLVVLIGLVFCRRRVARKDDETIHVLDSDADKIAEQAAIARKLDCLDRWVKILTILVVIGGIALAGLYLWAAWEATSGVPQG